MSAVAHDDAYAGIAANIMLHGASAVVTGAAAEASVFISSKKILSVFINIGLQVK